MPVMGSPWHCSGLGPGGGCAELGLLPLLRAAGKDGSSFLPSCSELSTGHGPAVLCQAEQLQDASLRPVPSGAAPWSPQEAAGTATCWHHPGRGTWRGSLGQGGAPLAAGLQCEAFNEGRSAQK